MKDYGRHFLVTKFVCAKCGNPMQLTYDVPKQSDYDAQIEDNITGASKVEQRIGLHPCEPCYREAVEPAELIRRAIEKSAALHSPKTGGAA